MSRCGTKFGLKKVKANFFGPLRRPFYRSQRSVTEQAPKSLGHIAGKIPSFHLKVSRDFHLEASRRKYSQAKLPCQFLQLLQDSFLTLLRSATKMDSAAAKDTTSDTSNDDPHHSKRAHDIMSASGAQVDATKPRVLKRPRSNTLLNSICSRPGLVVRGTLATLLKVACDFC
jgi:hypothetical protein